MALQAMSCVYCTTRIKPKPRNAILRAWTEQPWFTILVVSCSLCKEKTFIYVGEDPDDIERLRSKGITIEFQGDYAPKRIVRGYIELVGKPPIKMKPFTKKMRAVVEVEAGNDLQDGRLEAFLASLTKPGTG
jgi:hypothetical protein